MRFPAVSAKCVLPVTILDIAAGNVVNNVQRILVAESNAFYSTREGLADAA